MMQACSWCQENLGSVAAEGSPDRVISHGICENCSNRLLEGSGKRELGDFLDSLDGPVIVMSDNGTIRTANRNAQKLFKKDLTDIEDKKAGYVFECVFSKQPGGCGNTEHCDGCTIRKAVMVTLQSGKSCINIPAALDRASPDDFKRIDFSISTEMVKEVVLMRIDQASNN